MKPKPEYFPLPPMALVIGCVWCVCASVVAVQPASASSLSSTNTPTATPTATPTKPIPGFESCPGNVPVSTPGSLRGMVAAGFDLAGNPVLAVVDKTNSQVVVLSTIRNRFAAGDCTGAIQLSTVQISGGATAIAAADVDGDQAIDLAIGAQTGVVILHNDGKGAFNAQPTPQGATVTGVTAVAFNEDGPPDINLDGPTDVVVGTSSGQVMVLFGQNSAFKAVNQQDVGTLSGSVAVDFIVVKDLNGDGFPDIAAGSSSEVAVFLQNVNQPGTFSGKITVPTGQSSTSLVAGTFTFGEVPDLAITTSQPAQLSIYGGTKSADGTSVTYTKVAASDTGGSPVGLVADDLNADGKLDLVLANQDDHTVSFFLGDGTGKMTEQFDVCGQPGRCGVGTGPRSIVLAMLDLDGRNDVVTANGVDGSISVLLSGGLQPPPTGTLTATATVSPTPTVTPGGDCCAAHQGPGCDDPTCQTCVCPLDAPCCGSAWDVTCVSDATSPDLCAGKCACGMPAATPTTTLTPSVTPTATPTATPESNDCCQCGNQCGPPIASGCAPNCTRVADASCFDGQCILHTATPTATTTPTEFPPSATPTETGTFTPTATPTVTASASPTATALFTPTATPESCCQGSGTCGPPATPGSCGSGSNLVLDASCLQGLCLTHTPTQTSTPSRTVLRTQTRTPSLTPTNTPSFTPTPGITPTATAQCFAAGICVQGQSCAIRASDQGSRGLGGWLIAPGLLWLWRRRKR